jgi:hypothetical protein
MVWRDASPLHGLPWETRAALSLAVLSVALCAGLSGCGRRLPGAPGTGFLTISGHVYEQETPDSGEPLLAGVLITVQGASGLALTATSDAVGFYTLSIQGGIISITASKAGYESRVSSFDMLESTVLNFSLAPV